ncbi:hypothetical protein [Rhodococcus opacus]|uniref:Uncharacterized protein n=1 Tax=Rhodococcus opacus TaxID=37919 RepID=A0AAX3YQT6_RHOOP|nr:hypothetical protein [Rhodococcus opacus]WLF51553.1 hypothetical protein Q5707_39030 [Rhodococcus opacus]
MSSQKHLRPQPPTGNDVSSVLTHAETGIVENFVRALALKTLTEADPGRMETVRDTAR